MITEEQLSEWERDAIEHHQEAISSAFPGRITDLIAEIHRLLENDAWREGFLTHAVLLSGTVRLYLRGEGTRKSLEDAIRLFDEWRARSRQRLENFLHGSEIGWNLGGERR